MNSHEAQFPYYDDEEKKIVEAFFEAKFVPVENNQEWIETLREAAKRDPIITDLLHIHLPESDKLFIEQQAKDCGVSPEVLASQVLHRYVSSQQDEMR